LLVASRAEGDSPQAAKTKPVVGRSNKKQEWQRMNEAPRRNDVQGILAAQYSSCSAFASSSASQRCPLGVVGAHDSCPESLWERRTKSHELWELRVTTAQDSESSEANENVPRGVIPGGRNAAIDCFFSATCVVLALPGLPGQRYRHERPSHRCRKQ
jgi:hypothetical protein